MTNEEAQKYMAEVTGWSLIDGKKIQKEFKFKDTTVNIKLNPEP